jgi:hypothetical protein
MKINSTIKHEENVTQQERGAILKVGIVENSRENAGTPRTSFP